MRRPGPGGRAWAGCEREARSAAGGRPHSGTGSRAAALDRGAQQGAPQRQAPKLPPHSACCFRLPGLHKVRGVQMSRWRAPERRSAPSSAGGALPLCRSRAAATDSACGQPRMKAAACLHHSSASSSLCTAPQLPSTMRLWPPGGRGAAMMCAAARAHDVETACPFGACRPATLEHLRLCRNAASADVALTFACASRCSEQRLSSLLPPGLA